MICTNCRSGPERHRHCPGGNRCDCQHLPAAEQPQPEQETRP